MVKISKMKKEKRIKLNQLLIIAVAWMIAGALMTVYDHLLLLTANSLGPAEHYSFLQALTKNVIAGFTGAMLGGSLLVFYVNVRYRDKPYIYTLSSVIGFFLIVIAIVTLILGRVIFSFQTIKAVMIWSVIVGITQLLLQVSSKFGHGIFWKIMCGKYHTPQEEKKIFMFLDLNASTEIAEKLGDKQYHALLKDFFADITAPILDNDGQIYQYVGDEVIVAWEYRDGKQNARSIECFYDIKQHMEKNSAKYIRRYGLMPTFKAGIHCGSVVGGEVGILKRDITYSGDVLNTASRILNKCTEFNQELIASTDLIDDLRQLGNYITRPLGSIKLKGKAKEVLLNALIPAS